jgi:hypothetical protein
LTRYYKYWDPAEWEQVHDIIDWWRQHHNEYPVLSGMAFDKLSIPGMAAEVETIFSAAGRLITKIGMGPLLMSLKWPRFNTVACNLVSSRAYVNLLLIIEAELNVELTIQSI